MKLRPIFLWGAIALLLLALAGLAYLGTFTRFHADDFCMAADATQMGLASMLTKWYTTWTGRYMFILGTGLFGLGGPGFAAWLPALAEAVWLAGLSWTILPLIRRAGWPHPKRLAVISAALGLLVVLSATPNLFQSFLWQDGLVNYSLALIGLTFTGGILLRAWLQPANTWVTAIGVGVLAWVCGGFTEAFTAMQIAFLALLLGATLLFGDRAVRRRLLPVLGAGLVGGALALLIVISAPGNQVRQAAVGVDHPGLVRIVTLSVRYTIVIFEKFILKTPIWAFLSLSLPFLAGWMFTSGAGEGQETRKLWRQSWVYWLAAVTLTTFGLVAAICAAVLYGIDSYPDDRTIILPTFAIVWGVIGASALLGVGLRRNRILPDPGLKRVWSRILQAGMALILLAGVGISIWQTAGQVPEFQAYARSWDKRAGLIQQAVAAGETDVTAVGLNARFGVADLNESPDNWVNRCMAFYYHVGNLRGR